MSLHDARRIIADNIWDQVDLPENIIIESFNGWETTESGRETSPSIWRRMTFLQNPDNDELPTTPALFSISFYPNSVEVESVYLMSTKLEVPAPY